MTEAANGSEPSTSGGGLAAPIAGQLQWPVSYGTIYSNAVGYTTLEHVRREAQSVAKCPNFWVPKEAIESSTRQLMSTGEQVVAELYDRIMHSILPAAWIGAEWWIQVYEPGRGLAMHFDKDENIFRQHQVMRHPAFSSVLYLTGTAFDGRQGPTMVVDQQYDSQQKEAVPHSPARSVLVYPFPNNFCIFDGRLAHGVLDYPPCEGVRATMLINWWTVYPKDIKRISPSMIKRHKLGTPDTTNGSAHEAPASDSELAEERETEPERLPVPEVTASKHPDGGALLVDELLEQASVRLCSTSGESVSHAVAISHAGMELFPLDLDSCPGAVTGAALVNETLLSTDESEPNTPNGAVPEPPQEVTELTHEM